MRRFIKVSTVWDDLTPLQRWELYFRAMFMLYPKRMYILSTTLMILMELVVFAAANGLLNYLFALLD